MTDRFLKTSSGYFCVDDDGVVRKYSDAEGIYSVHNGLTETQARYVRARAKVDGERVTTEPEAQRAVFGWYA